MLSLAIATTLVGFALLVVGLITGQVWFAIACIVICLIGVGLLLADVVRSGRAAKAQAAPSGPSVFDDAVDDDATQVVASPLRRGRRQAEAVQPVAPAPPQRVPDQSPVAEPDAGAPPAAAAQVADQSVTPAAEGTFTDYVATTGGFTMPTRPSAAQSAQNEAEDTGPVPRVDVPGLVGSGVRWESSIAPAQSEFVDREASNWLLSGASAAQRNTGGWAATPSGQRKQAEPAVQPRESVTRSRHHEASDGSVSGGASGMPKFDPLDPNWHPPPE